MPAALPDSNQIWCAINADLAYPFSVPTAGLMTKLYRHIENTQGGVMESAKEWKQKLRYLPHNLIGHPPVALFHLFGLWRLSEWIHNKTLPK